MAASSVIWHGAGPSPLTNTSATATTTPSSAGSATISANDFLSLLVTEMQNQDPTATTDPNEYINQLVNVNSLEQLVDINQTLSSTAGQSTGAAAGAHANPTSQPTALPNAGRNVIELAAQGMASVAGAQILAARSTQGNLNMPDSKPAALSVAHALTPR